MRDSEGLSCVFSLTVTPRKQIDIPPDASEQQVSHLK